LWKTTRRAGGDHVDSHHTTAFVAGSWVKSGVVSTAYNTIDFIRTMKEVRRLPPVNLNDALATPMSDAFNTSAAPWSFTAVPASILYCTSLPLPGPAQSCLNPTPDAAYWARVTKGMDFNDADRVDGVTFNHILWKGLMGNRPYPAAPTGVDLRQNCDSAAGSLPEVARAQAGSNFNQAPSELIGAGRSRIPLDY